MIVAIDGPAGSGKSTTAKQAAKLLQFVHIDTGAMYRAVTYYFQIKDISLNDSQLIKDSLNKINITFNDCKLYLNDMDVSTQIRSNSVSRHVSVVSAIPEVRSYLVKIQRKMSENLNVVLEGRDIGTRVFPNANVKIFLNAGIDIRGKRRFNELKSENSHISLEQVINELQKRDEIDSNRQHSPLKKAHDAIEIDTSNMSINEQVNKIVEIINKHRSETH